MSDEKKPQEFWIQNRSLHYEAETEKVLDDDIHVIEYSAFEHLVSENKKLNLQITSLMLKVDCAVIFFEKIIDGSSCIQSMLTANRAIKEIKE